MAQFDEAPRSALGWRGLQEPRFFGSPAAASIRATISILNGLTPSIHRAAFDEQPGKLHVMAIFRCYYLNADNHIQQVEIIEAKALGEAIEKGLAMLRQSPYPAIEIWDGATKVFPVSAPAAIAADS